MLPLRPHRARIYIQNEKEKYWHAICSYQTNSKIQSAHHNGAVFFLLLSPPPISGCNPFLSFPFSRHCVPTKKLTNRPRDAQVRLFIKKFLLRSPHSKSIRRCRRSGLRSKNLFALPPPSPPPSLPFGRYCFTILYYTAWYRRISPVWI